MRQQFYESVCAYLEQVTEANFSRMYKGLITIVIEYIQSLSKEIILSVFDTIFQKNNLNDWQYEVLDEVYTCIVGQCTPSKIINLK